MEQDRSRELAERLAEVRDRIADACGHARRSVDEVALVAVTKTFPVEDLETLVTLGVTDIGENRDQEARAKHAASAHLQGVRWHFVGQLQTNKARSVAAYADVVHSVDRLSLIRALGRAATGAGRTVRCLLQVRFDPAPGPMGQRGGADPSELPELAAAVADEPALELGGVMGIPPLGADPRGFFERLRTVAVDLRRIHPEAHWISAGMSQDFDIAIEYGATHVRVGRRLLGERPTRR
ncbi:MAG TPA: YggS family pyridoxal phosphate-dependent enzyme [Actinopolymorphaceae bacterium]